MKKFGLWKQKLFTYETLTYIMMILIILLKLGLMGILIYLIKIKYIPDWFVVGSILIALIFGHDGK